MHQGKISSIKSSLDKLIRKHNRDKDKNIFHTLNEEYSDIKSQLYKDPEIEGKFSEKFIDRKLLRLAKIGVEEPQNLDRELDDFIEFLESYDTEFHVFLPLSGIEVQPSDQEFQLGNICVVQSTPELRDEVKQVLIGILKRNPRYSDIEEEEYLSSRTYIITECFDAPTVARYSVVAEPIRARERAEEEARRVIEVLRFYGMIGYDPGWNVRICLMHESNPRIKSVVGYSDERFVSSESVSGPLKNLKLSEAFIEKMEQSGANKLLGLISKVSLTEFEEKLLLAIHWLATSQMQYDNESKFLNLVSALESLLTRDSSYPIAISVAEGAAILLGDDLSERIRIRDEVKEYYGKRSRLSHGGSKPVYDSDLEGLQHYTVSLLLVLLKRTDEFNNQDDLFNWLDTQKLKG